MPGTKRHSLISLSFEVIGSLSSLLLFFEPKKKPNTKSLITSTLNLLLIHLKKTIIWSFAFIDVWSSERETVIRRWFSKTYNSYEKIKSLMGAPIDTGARDMSGETWRTSGRHSKLREGRRVAHTCQSQEKWHTFKEVKKDESIGG